MKIAITGVAGFVGSNLADLLLSNNHEVVGVDNFSTGYKNHILQHKENKNFSFHKLDLSADFDKNIFSDCDCIVHLAALADIRYNKNNFKECLNKNVLATNNVIEACVDNNVKKLLFASTCSVYGDVLTFPTKESEVNNQTSVYSSTKIASEMLLEGFANTFDLQAYTMRFVSMLGQRYSHGHVFDFTKKILNNETLNVLGSGDGIKSYLHIKDAVRAIDVLINHNSVNKFEAYNIGHSSTIKLKYSVETITEYLNYTGEIKFGEGASGWVGDVPVISPSVEKMKQLGWEPKFSIKKGITDTIDYLVDNQWLLNPNS
jgi:UDP-glucose 4-epimerase